MSDWDKRLWRLVSLDGREYMSCPFHVRDGSDRWAVATDGHVAVGLVCTDADAPTGRGGGSVDLGRVQKGILDILHEARPLGAHCPQRGLSAFAGTACHKERCHACDGDRHRFTCQSCGDRVTCQACNGTAVEYEAMDPVWLASGVVVNRKLLASALSTLPPDDRDAVVLEVRWQPPGTGLRATTAPVVLTTAGWWAIVMPMRPDASPSGEPFLSPDPS